MVCRRAWCLVFSGLLTLVTAASNDLPNSFPHVYPGQPKGDFSPEWQSYFQVTEKLPNVTFDLGRSFAGNIPVQRAGHPNNTLFFYAFEKSNGSLTVPANESNDEPWAIWLNGGPGSSSMYGLFFENGPIRIQSDYSIKNNNYSWDKLADYFWIDQPVGVGHATADSEGYVTDEDQVGEDFMGFLGNLVKVFPSLATRPLHITGESYAGVYIPYIMRTYFGMSSPPVRITKIAMGNAAITSGQAFEFLPVVSVLETYPQIIGYDTEVFEYFKQQSALCSYNVNLTYPQDGIIPSIPFAQPALREIPFLLRQNKKKKLFTRELETEALSNTLSKRDRELGVELWKRDLSGRANGTTDPWYGCFLYDMMLDYALNFTFPWNESLSFDPYDVQDALNPPDNQDATIFLNDNRTRAALHAPTSKDWVTSIDTTFIDRNTKQPLIDDPSPEPMIFLSELATNFTNHGVGVVIYSGNDDTLIPHFGSEIAIQNTTFGGIQGFTRRPSTPWQNDVGKFAGIVHQERNWTYVLFSGAGHLVPQKQPDSAFAFVREFILGSNTTGLVTNSGVITVVGGENSTLAQSILPGADEIFYGSSPVTSTYAFPSATRAAWKAFAATAQPSVIIPSTSPTSEASANSVLTFKRYDTPLLMFAIASLVWLLC